MMQQKKRHKRLIKILLCLLIAGVTNYLAAEEDVSNNIILLVDKNSRLHDQFLNSLNPTITKNTNIRHYDSVLPAKKDFIITLGTKACEHTIKYQKNTNILCTLLPSFKFQLIKKQNINSNRISAIYIDQPVKRRLDSIKKHFPNIKNVAVIQSSKNQKTYNNSASISINTYQSKNSQDTLKIFNQISLENDAILATEDKLIYNNKTIQQILLLSYRKKIPIFGFSKSFVKAGAIASIYSSINDLSIEIEEVISRYKANRYHMPIEKHPKYFTVSFNKQVIQALAIEVSEYE